MRWDVKKELRIHSISKITENAVTIDDNTLESGMVTVRERDAMTQESVPLAELITYVQERLMG